MVSAGENKQLRMTKKEEIFKGKCPERTSVVQKLQGLGVGPGSVTERLNAGNKFSRMGDSPKWVKSRRRREKKRKK